MTLNPSAIWDATDAGQNPSKSDITTWANSRLTSYATKAALEADDVPSLVVCLTIQGYTAAGDQGGGNYKRVASEPSHEGKIQSSDGAWWELVPINGCVTSKQFGEVGDGVADDTAPIQNMIHYAYYNDGTTSGSKEVRCYVVGPECKTTDTIHAGYGVGFKGGLVLSGMGNKRRGEALNIGTVIQPTFTDRPVINIQGARRVVIKDMFIDGALDYSSIGTTGIEPTEEATWAAIDTGTRYAPYAGITVDAYAGTRPGTSYPDVTYPSFLGAVAQYGKNTSSQARIENVGFSSLTTAVAVQPSDVSSNGDFTQILDCSVEFCAYGVSVGTTQSRNFEINNVEFANVHTAIATNKHGKQTGQLGGPIFNISIGAFCAQMFSLSGLAVANSPQFINPFAENIHKIGEITGAASSDSNISFHGANINFRHSDTNGHPASVLEGSTRGTITFYGGKIQGFDSVVTVQPIRTRLRDGVAVTCGNSRTKDYEKIAHNTLSGGFLSETFTPLAHEIQFVPFNVTTGSAITATPATTDEFYDYTDRDHAGWPLACPVAHRRGKVDNGLGRVERPYFYKTISKGTFDSVTLGTGASGRVLTLVDSDLDEADILNGIANGCIIRDLNTDTVWFIRSYDDSTGTIIAEQQNNYIDDGASGYEAIETISESTGSLEFIQGLLFTPDTPLRGDTSNVTANITNLITAAGSGETSGGTSANNELAAGDWYYAGPSSFVPINNTASAEISSITSGSNLITMAGNLRKVKTELPLDYWLLSPPSDEASR